MKPRSDKIREKVIYQSQATTMILRSYQADDLRAVTKFLGKNWKDSKFTNYHPGDIIHWMSNKYRGKSLDQYFYIAEEAHKIIAVVEFDAKHYSAYAPILDISKRGGAWELAFHKACVAEMSGRLNTLKKKTLTVNCVEGDESANILLPQLNFKPKKSDYVQLIRNLEDIPKTELPEGFSIRVVAGEHEAELVADVHASAFGSKWTEAEYLKVMRTPGFEIERELVVVAPNGRFAAFVIVWFDPISLTGSFEPVGCHSDFRRMGLTKALMYEGMARMKDAGMRKAHVGYESEAASKFYRYLNFETYFETVDWVLKL